jgi:F-type H+-transporting ATPase subunit gamma
MASLAELRVKIGGIRSTQQITKAMKMIAGARLGRAQKHALDAAAFSSRLQDIFYGSLYAAGGTRDLEGEPGRWHNFQKSPQTDTCVLVLVSSDKGLCGGFNNSILHAAGEFIKGQGSGSVSLFVVGRKAQEYCQRNSITPAASFTNVFASLDREQVARIGVDLVKHCEERGIIRIIALYNKSKSIMRQVPVQEELWPLPPPPASEQVSACRRGAAVGACEPSPEAVFDEFFPLYIQAKIRQVLSVSYASELAARMTAMDSASRNAQKLIDEFTLTMNNVRQSGITRELSEIIGASEVFK